MTTNYFTKKFFFSQKTTNATKTNFFQKNFCVFSMLIKHVKLFYQIEFNKSKTIKSNSLKSKLKGILPRRKNNEDKSLQG